MGMLVNPYRYAAAPGGGGGVTVRGTDIITVSDDAFNVPFVAGAAAGDRVFLFGSSAWEFNTIAGWTTHHQDTGSFINGGVFSKVLDAADITAGSVAVTFDGAYGETVVQVCFVGDVTVRDTNSSRNHVSNTDLATDASPQVGDEVFWFAGLRDGSSSTIDLGTTIEVQTAGNAHGRLNQQTVSSAGVQSATYSCTGFIYAAVVAVF